MSSGDATELRGELLDDFYTESDEHLGTIRRELLALEQPAAPSEHAAALDRCFRSMHTMKGNAAIIGLHSAEALTHAAEDLFRLLLRQPVGPDADALQLLGRVAGSLEAIVAAHRREQPIPEADTLIKELREFVAGLTNHPPAADGAPASGPAAPVSAVARWVCVFSPTQELDRRGVNINSVRARLGELGEIVSAVPSVQPKGAMQFEFTVAVRQPPTDPGAWAADGMIFRPALADVVEPERRTAGPSPAPSSSLYIAPSHVVRVDLARLDELMRITGEMVIHRSRLADRIARSPDDHAALQEVNLALGRSLRELRDAITRVRLVPVGEVFNRMPFVVRDLARDTGKQVRLVVDGEHTEIDKYVVERLKEPLLHLVRNAVSHGVELPSVRVAAGKPPEAVLRLSASTVGSSVVIRICDDGAGIDRTAIVARAQTLGISVPPDPSDEDILDVLCRAGFSTRDEADRAAGRGVGMAVVRTTIRELGGSLSFAAERGVRTQFNLRLPLTLSIAETFLVTAGEHTCALPQEFVREILPVTPADLLQIQHAEVLSCRGEILPVLRLRGLFGLSSPPGAPMTALVLNTDNGQVALVVDRVHGRREVVVRALKDPLVQVPGITGATELGDGRPVLILDAAALAGRRVAPTARMAERISA